MNRAVTGLEQTCVLVTGGRAMNLKLCGLLLAVVPQLGFAAAVGGFVNGGFSSVTFSGEVGGDTIDLEDGNGFNVTGGVRFKPGLMVRAGFSSSNHDGGVFCISGSGCTNFSDEVDLEEFRLGVFYAPQVNDVVGFLIGGGYESLSFQVEGSPESDPDGTFFEGAVLLNAGRVVTFDIGGAVFALEDDDGFETDGTEFRVGATFHAGPVDIGVGWRGIYLETDYGGGDIEEDDVGEARLTIGGSWGYPKGRRGPN